VSVEQSLLFVVFTLFAGARAVDSVKEATKGTTEHRNQNVDPEVVIELVGRVIRVRLIVLRHLKGDVGAGKGRVETRRAELCAKSTT